MTCCIAIERTNKGSFCWGRVFCRT